MGCPCGCGRPSVSQSLPPMSVSLWLVPAWVGQSSSPHRTGRFWTLRHFAREMAFPGSPVHADCEHHSSRVSQHCSGTAQAERRVCDLVSQDHGVIQRRKAPGTFPIQLTAQRRVSHKVRPGCPALHHVGAGKTSGDGDQ